MGIVASKESSVSGVAESGHEPTLSLPSLVGLSTSELVRVINIFSDALRNEDTTDFCISPEEPTDQLLLQQMIGATASQRNVFFHQRKKESKESRVDVLQTLACMTLFSCASDQDKIRIILEMYSFEEDLMLTFDELYLSIQSSLFGVKRVCEELQVYKFELRDDFAMDVFVDDIIGDAHAVSVSAVQNYFLHANVHAIRFFRSLQVVFANARTFQPRHNPLPEPNLESVEHTRQANAFQGRLCSVRGASGGLVIGQDGHLAYTAASAVVVDQCRFFWHHTSSITCIVASRRSPVGPLACSVECGKALVWNMADHSIHAVLVVPSKLSPLSVSFVGEMDEFIVIGLPGRICVFEWELRSLVHTFNVKGLPQHVHCTRGDEFAACGFNRYAEFFVLSSKEARAGVCTFAAAHFHSLAYQEKTQQVITGADSGKILIWEGRKCIKLIAEPVASGNITALFACEWGLCSAGANGTIQLWTIDVDLLATFDLSSDFMEEAVSVAWWRSIDEIIYVVTRDTALYGIDVRSGEVKRHGAVTLKRSRALSLQSDVEEVSFQGEDGCVLTCTSVKRAEREDSSSDRGRTTLEMESRKEGSLLCCHGFKGPHRIFAFGQDSSEFIYPCANVIDQRFLFPTQIVSVDKSSCLLAACDSYLCMVWDISMDVCYSQVNTRPDHGFQAVVFSTCGRYLAIQSTDGDLELIETVHGFIKKGTFHGFNQDIVILSNETVIEIDCQRAHVLQSGRDHTSYSLQLDPPVENSPKFIAYQDWWGDECGYLWRVQSGSGPMGTMKFILRRVSGVAHRGGICAVNANVTAGLDSAIVLWSDTSKVLRRVTTDRPCYCVCKEGGAVEDGHRVFNFETEKEVTGTHQRIVKVCTRPAQADEYSSIGNDGVSLVFRKTELIYKLVIPNCPELTECTYNYGSHLAIGTVDGQILIYDEGTLYVPLRTKPEASIVSLVYSLDDRRLAVCNSLGKLFFYEMYDLCGIVDLKGVVPLSLNFAREDEVVRATTFEQKELYFDSVSAQTIPETLLKRDWVEEDREASMYRFVVEDTCMYVYTREADVNQVLYRTQRVSISPISAALPEKVFGQSLNLPVFSNENDLITYIACRHLVAFDPSVSSQTVLHSFQTPVRMMSIRGSLGLVITGQWAHFVGRNSGEVLLSWPVEDAKLCALTEDSCCAVYTTQRELKWIDAIAQLSVRYSWFDEDHQVCTMDFLSRQEICLGFEDSPEIWFLQVFGTALVKTRSVELESGVPTRLVQCLVGTSEGLIYRCSDGVLTLEMKAHREGITAIHIASNGMIVTASEDPEVKLWKDKECLLITALQSPTTSLDMDSAGAVILLDSGQLFVDTSSIDPYPFSGHRMTGTDAVIGMEEVYSIGQDNTLRVWSISRCVCTRILELEEAPVALALRPGTDQIAIVCGRAIYALDCEDLEVECQSYIGKSNVEYLTYTSRSELVIQTSSSRFYKADCENEYAIKGPFKGTEQRKQEPLRIEDNCVSLYRTATKNKVKDEECLPHGKKPINEQGAVRCGHGTYGITFRSEILESSKNCEYPFTAWRQFPSTLTLTFRPFPKPANEYQSSVDLINWKYRA